METFGQKRCVTATTIISRERFSCADLIILQEYFTSSSTWSCHFPSRLMDPSDPLNHSPSHFGILISMHSSPPLLVSHLPLFSPTTMSLEVAGLIDALRGPLHASNRPSKTRCFGLIISSLSYPARLSAHRFFETGSRDYDPASSTGHE